ncbi:MAG: hypothetical protein ACLUVV_05635 [Christensenellales bacterium]
MKRNRIHTLAVIMLCLMLCFSMLPIPLAFAADITVSNVSVTPSSLSGGGNVTVKYHQEYCRRGYFPFPMPMKVNKDLAAGDSYTFPLHAAYPAAT